MRQLDSCDFCGDEPEGVFEVVPASVAGDARRLALCADCRATLQSVVDPLLAAVEAGESMGGAQAGADESTETDDASHELDATPTEEPEPEVSDVSTSPDDGVTIDAGGSSDGEESDATAEPDAAGGSTGLGKSSTTGNPGTTGESSRRRERKPEGYAKVLRLLQNRDGAMPREDLRALATNAYDLEGRQFEDVVDAAVENGDLQETGDGLQTE